MTTTKPRAYQYWPQFAKDAYDEREAIALEGSNWPPNEPTPPEIIRMATDDAINAMTHYNTHCGLCGRKKHEGPCYKERK